MCCPQNGSNTTLCPQPTCNIHEKHQIDPLEAAGNQLAGVGVIMKSETVSFVTAFELRAVF